MKIIYVLFMLIVLAGSLYGQESYGISSAYLDTRTREMLYDFSMYSPVKDGTMVLFEWSSYTYYWRREIMSKQWANYWFSPGWAIGTEIELWYTFNKDYTGTQWSPNKLYITPRIGFQYRWW